MYDDCSILLLLLNVLEETGPTTFCKKQLNEEDYQAFAYAIKNKYWYQMYIGKKFHLMIWPYLHDIVSITEEQELQMHRYLRFCRLLALCSKQILILESQLYKSIILKVIKISHEKSRDIFSGLLGFFNAFYCAFIH